jgi:hypothetical protein
LALASSLTSVAVTLWSVTAALVVTRWVPR